ncbi:Seven transmembrane MLO family protein [Theobroma cacao]|uniref:MLO-like protein n=1 Tax=Theobroma cacao TaxID=3641 RepID=A0A061F0F7_THECC|nr:Seven transmembrane MLO family protein [Theobroma cacao]
MSEGGEGASLEFTPTWVLAAVCTVIVAISLAMERLLHYLGNILKKKQQKPLFEALLKVKEELMLLGFISLLLTVFQSAISKICISREAVTSMLPCKIEGNKETAEHSNSTATTSHFQKYFAFTLSGGTRRLLAETSSASQMGYCGEKNKVPLLSVEALHHLHIFIFVLAIVHVTFCVLTVSFGGLRIRQWKHWEDSIAKENYDPEQMLKKKVTHVREHTFIKEHFLGIGKDSIVLGWLHSFFKQFYASVTKSDYVTLRLGFIMTHCRGNPKFNFHKYMIRALEDDFKQVVGISWYLWVFVVIFLLLNVNGWHTYFWIAFIPFILLLAVGTKLEHVIIQLAHEVAEKHVAIEGELVVQPSDDHFWFNKPRIVLFLIHFILFQNAFEIAFFFWIWVQFGFDSCIMGQIGYIIPRLVIGVFIQVLCSYSTLPLYAIVTQMGSSFKKAIFDEHVQAGLVGWAQKAKKKKGLRAATEAAAQEERPSVAIQMGRVLRNAAAPEEITPSHGSDHGSR